MSKAEIALEILRLVPLDVLTKSSIIVQGENSPEKTVERQAAIVATAYNAILEAIKNSE